VPIVPDEARTFGMESLFRTVGIYSSIGQKYEPVDVQHIALLQRSQGRTDPRRGHHRSQVPWPRSSLLELLTPRMVSTPFRLHLLLDVWLLQRIGDFIWAAADMRTRGFMLGGTAGTHDAFRRRPPAPGRQQPCLGFASSEQQGL